MMLQLVEAYSVKVAPDAAADTLKPHYNVTADKIGEVVSALDSQVLLDLTINQILTGATGSLGIHVLAQLLARTHLRVVALVRASSDAEALERVQTNFERRELLNCYGPHRERVRVFAADLRDKKLGLSDAIYDACLQSAVAVVHVCF